MPSDTGLSSTSVKTTTSSPGQLNDKADATESRQYTTLTSKSADLAHSAFYAPSGGGFLLLGPSRGDWLE